MKIIKDGKIDILDIDAKIGIAFGIALIGLVLTLFLFKDILLK